jgi:hypothetical protein
VGGSATDVVYQMIRQAEHDSEETCETCGRPGKVCGRGWLKCRCSEHGGTA